MFFFTLYINVFYYICIAPNINRNLSIKLQNPTDGNIMLYKTYIILV